MSRYSVGLRLADAYSKEKRGYLASSRIRGHYLSKYWPECDDFFYPEEFPEYEGDFFNPVNQFKILKNYDAVIFNKAYEHKLVKLLRENGQIVIVDFCDPDFLLSHSSEQRVSDCLKTLKYTTLAVVNGKAIKEELRKVYKGPIVIIPDRLDLEGLSRKETHNRELKKIVWYGYSENLRVLEPYMKDIIDMGLEITIISDRFFESLTLVGCKFRPSERVSFRVWHPETVNEQILGHDAVFIGRDLDPYLSKFKSDNRADLAHALNMPVAYDIKDLERLKPVEARIIDSKEGLRDVRRYKDVRHSVFVYDKIMRKLLRRRNEGSHRK